MRGSVVLEPLMSSILQPHVLAIASGAVLIVGLVLIFYGRTTLQRLRIPDREDDAAGFRQADKVLERGMFLLRAGDIIGIIGGVGVLLTMLMYAGIIPGFEGAAAP